jgi:hypothetical protein
MNNEKVMELITAVGALSELWAVTYNNFLKQGFNKSDARAHTKEFMSVLVHEIMTCGG